MLTPAHASRMLLLLVFLVALASADPQPKGYGLFRRADTTGSSILLSGDTAGTTTTRIKSSISAVKTSSSISADLTTTASQSSTSTPPSTSAEPVPTPTTQSTTPTTSPQPSTSTPPPSSITTAPSQTISRVTLVTLVTENGSTFSSAYESSTTVAIQPTSLADNNNSSGGGLSSSTKAIIGGVVGGIGGVIVLAVLFAVIWRLRKNRKNKVNEDDVLMNGRGYHTGTGSAGGEKDSAASGSPFKSTLESYHNPAAPVNASSNF